MPNIYTINVSQFDITSTRLGKKLFAKKMGQLIELF